MGCLKLHTEENFTPLKIAYRKADKGSEKVVQRFLRPDPMAYMRSEWTPYTYCSNNPTNRTDPTGMLDEWYSGGKETPVLEGTSNSQGGGHNAATSGPPTGQEGFVFDNKDNTMKWGNKDGSLGGINLQEVAVSGERGGNEKGDGGQPSAGGVMAATMIAGAATAEFPPAAALVVGVGSVIATGVGIYNLLNPNLEGTHTTYQPTSQSPLNNSMRGFDPEQGPNGDLKTLLKVGMVGFAAYRLYHEYNDHINNMPTLPILNPIDKTYVSPKPYHLIK